MTRGWVSGGAVALAATALWTSSAEAQVVDLTARTVFHDYRVSVRPDAPLRAVSRFYAAVAGGAYQLGPDGQFDVIASVRYDTDFGTGFRLDTPLGAPLPTVDGQNDVDVLFLHVDWRNMIGREFDLRVGRQVHVDDLDFFVFDGLKLIGHLWREGIDRFDLDLYAGSPVRYDAVFASTEALLGDGTEVYDGESPFGGMAIGANAFLRLASDLTVSVSWRNELVFREKEILAFGPSVAVGEDAGAPIDGAVAERERAALGSSEAVGLQVSLLGGSVGYELRPLKVTLTAGGVFDLLAVRLDRARVALAWAPQSSLRFDLEGLRIRPRFLGDSIFNWFAAYPYDELRAGASAELLQRRLRVRAHWFVQRFLGGELTNPAGDADALHGPRLALEWRERRFGVDAFGEAAFGFTPGVAVGGDWASVGVGGYVNLLADRLGLDGRVSWAAVGFEGVGLDAARRDTLTAAIGARGAVLRWLQARAYYAHTFAELAEGRHRLFVELAARYR